MNSNNIIEATALVNNIEKRAMRDAYENVLDIIDEKQELINRLLTSKEAMNIVFTTYGKRFDRLNAKRQSLRAYYYNLNKLWCQITELQQATFK